MAFQSTARAVGAQRLVLLLSGFLASPGAARVIQAPTFTIWQIEHNFSGDQTLDGVRVSGVGYTCSGFTAALATGDIVRVRIEPEAGKKFVFRSGTGPRPAWMSLNLYWSANSGVGTSHFNPSTLTFENLEGVGPTPYYVLAAANPNVIEIEDFFDLSRDFACTGIQVDILVDETIREVFDVAFSSVRWHVDPAVGVAAYTSDPNYRAFELVPAGVVGARRTDWGKVKALFR